MTIEERKAQVKAAFRDVFNWWLSCCELKKDEAFFLAAAREMVKLSAPGDPLKNSLLTAVYAELDRLAAQEQNDA